MLLRYPLYLNNRKEKDTLYLKITEIKKISSFFYLCSWFYVNVYLFFKFIFLFMIKFSSEKKIIDDLYSSSSIDDINVHFTKLCNHFHIERFALAKISDNKRSPFLRENKFEIFDTYPKEWMNMYIKKNFYEFDPVYKLIDQTYFPQTWHVNDFNNLSDPERKIFEIASDFSISTGTTIPIKNIDASKIYFTSADRIIHHPEVLYILSHAARIYWDVYQKQISNISFTQLTQKEKEIFLLKKQGLLSKNIADNLNISMATVAFHLKNIRQKLKCSRTEQAVYSYNQ